MWGIQPSPEFLARTRQLLAATRNTRGVGRNLYAWIDVLFRWTGNPFVLGIAFVAPPLIGTLDPAPRHFSLSLLLFIGIAYVGFIIDSQVRNHPHLVLFALLPVHPIDVFHRQAARAARHIGFMSAAAGIGFAILAFNLHSSTGLGMPLLAGLLIALFFPVVAVTYALAAARSRWLAVPMALSLPVTVLLLLAIKGSKGFETRVGQLMSAHGDLLAAFLPTGWIVLPWSALIENGPWHLAVALVPLVPLLATLPLNLRWTRDHYRYRDAILLNLFLEAPEDADEELTESVAIAHQSPPSRGETAIVDDILNRAFLSSNLKHPPGRIEALVWQWWTPRQRLVAEYLRLSWPDWSGRWGTGSIILACTIPVSVTLGLWAPDWLPISFIGYVAGALYLLPISSSFTLRPTVLADSGIQVSPIHVLPVSFAEVATVQWKATVIRALAALPVSTATAAIASGFLGHGYGVGALIGAQVALIWVAIRPALTVYRFQAVNRGWMKGLISYLGLAFVVAILLLDILGVMLCAIPGAGLIATAALLPVNYLALRLTTGLLARRGIDSIHAVPAQ